jgi:ABC-type multidrug transport system fused ATPase/permease subunit
VRREIPAVVWGALRRDPRRLIQIAIWSVAEAAPAFVIGHAIARAIEDGFAAARPWVGLGWLAVLGAAWLVAAIGARQVVLALAALVEPFRDQLLRHVVDATLHRATAPGSPDAGPAGPGDHTAVARSTLQVELARDSLASVISVVRSFAFTVLSVVLGMMTLIPEVLWLVIPPFAAGLGLFLISLPALARRQRAFILADEDTVETVTTVVTGLRDIVACGAEERVGAAADRQVARQAATGRALARVTAVRTLSLAVGGWLPVVTVLAGAPWLLRGGAGAGVIVGTLAYVTQSLTPALNGLVEGLGVSGVRLAVSLDRILDPENGAAARDPRPPRATPIPPGRARVELQGVTFAYGARAEPVIADLDLVVPDGDHLAVVGPSGIGKSTLAALISGLLAPGEGKVLVGGVPAGHVAPADRVLIPQEAYVFRGPLRDNLTYLAGTGGRPAPAQRAIEEAVAAVGMTQLVRRLGGYSADVDPAALSAGERQLIALVRAYLSAARLVILDEATCHLDPAAEAHAEEAFARRDGTLIVIAHRISSALRARRVLLMDGTRVLLGTHAELIGAAPLYADLVGLWQPPALDQNREYAS